jgi:hypothetical protein
MEAIKIITHKKGEHDVINYFNAPGQIMVIRGHLKEVKDNPTMFNGNGTHYPIDKWLFSGDTEKAGLCKLVLLFLGNEKALRIVTDSSIYLLGSNGKTIEAIH